MCSGLVKVKTTDHINLLLRHSLLFLGLNKCLTLPSHFCSLSSFTLLKPFIQTQRGAVMPSFIQLENRGQKIPFFSHSSKAEIVIRIKARFELNFGQTNDVKQKAHLMNILSHCK